MPQSWGPTAFGKLFTHSTDWKLILTGGRFRFESGRQRIDGCVLNLEQCRIELGRFWATIRIPLPDGPVLSLDGIPNSAAKEMAIAIEKAIKRVRDFSHVIKPVSQWANDVRAACSTQLTSKGWLTAEFKQVFNSIKPRGLENMLADPEVLAYVEAQSQDIKDAVSQWKRDFSAVADSINEEHLARELRESNAFFQKVEKSPLTDEQARAVVCFDNRVLLVASAGSGKTSTMVAKAGYALAKGYCAADRMLLLAFNNDAAAELRERIKERLAPLGLSPP